jgi:acetoin utilization protein AcuB
MRIERWMKHPVHTVKPLESVRHAREVMERFRINQLPVVVDGRLVGIVTDRDLRDAFPSIFEPPHRATSKTRVDPSTIPVESVMTANVLSVGPHDLVADAARVMRRERVGALPVVDGGHLVGILARSDVLEALVSVIGDAPVGSGAG